MGWMAALTATTTQFFLIRGSLFVLPPTTRTWLVCGVPLFPYSVSGTVKYDKVKLT